MSTNSPGLEALLASFSSNLFLPKPATPSPSSTGMFPSPNSPYSSMSDQILDAFRYTGTLPGGPPINPLGGNLSPRYAFAGNPANLGGNNLGQNAHKGLFTGTGLLGGGAAPPGSSAAPPGYTYNPPNSSGGIGGSGGLGPVTPGAGLLGRSASSVPGNLLRQSNRTQPAGAPVDNAYLGSEAYYNSLDAAGRVKYVSTKAGQYYKALAAGQTPPAGTGPYVGAAKSGGPTGGGLLAPPNEFSTGMEAAFGGSENFGGHVTPEIANMARSSNGQGVIDALQGTGVNASRVIGNFQPGGGRYQPHLNALAQQGRTEPEPGAAAAQWAAEGLGTVGPNGEWIWAPGKGWDNNTY